MMRFTSRDPVFGKFTEPYTLHKYLYCWNNPENLVDFTGETPMVLVGALAGGVVGLVQGVFAFTTFMIDVENSGIRMSEKDINKAFYGFVLGHTIKGAAVGAVTTLTGGIDSALTYNIMSKVTDTILSGVIGAEIYKYYDKQGSIKDGNGIKAANYTRQAAILSYIELNF